MEAVKFASLFKQHLDAWCAAVPERSKSQLAREIGVDPSLISHYLKGTVSPDPQGPVLARVCAAFGLDVEQARALYSALGIDLGPVLPPVGPESTAAVEA
jgi:transcriptional regulator with XRE-family HTH domain